MVTELASLYVDRTAFKILGFIFDTKNIVKKN
jgi:hypothetical protein